MSGKIPGVAPEKRFNGHERESRILRMAKLMAAAGAESEMETLAEASGLTSPPRGTAQPRTPFMHEHSGG